MLDAPTSRPFRTAAVALSTVLAFAACTPRSAPQLAAAPSAAQPSTTNLRVYDSKAAKFIPFTQLVQTLSRADVVFFGEQHDDPATHATELALLAAIGERRPQLVLTMEMFETDVQPQLDRYLAGSISEAAFLAGARPWPQYTTDYRPLVELARIRGWPVVGANVPRRIATAVSRKGLAVLDTMTTSERVFAAKDNSCPKDVYYKNFAEEMSGHGAGGGPPSASDAEAARVITDRFYEAQCVKDETMGASIASAWTKAGAGALVFQVDGAFHSNFGLGTAERLRRRAPSAKTVVLTAIPVADPATANAKEFAARADYVLFTRAPVK